MCCMEREKGWMDLPLVKRCFRCGRLYAQSPWLKPFLNCSSYWFLVVISILKLSTALQSLFEMKFCFFNSASPSHVPSPLLVPLRASYLQPMLFVDILLYGPHMEAWGHKIIYNLALFKFHICGLHSL